MSAAGRRPDLVIARSGPDGGDWLAATLAGHPAVAAIPPGSETSVNPSTEAFPASTPLATVALRVGAADAFAALGACAVGDGPRTLWQADRALLLPHFPFVINEALQDARVVVCVRDPVELVAQLWNQTAPELRPGDSLADAVGACDAAMRETSRFDVRGDWPDHLRDLPLRATLLEHGMYGPILSRWLRVLGPDRVRVVPLSRLLREPNEAIHELLEYFGIEDSDGFAESVVAPPAERWPAATETERASLASRYAASDRQLAAAFGADATPWA